MPYLKGGYGSQYQTCSSSVVRGKLIRWRDSITGRVFRFWMAKTIDSCHQLFSTNFLLFWAEVFIFLFFLLFWPCRAACGILVPRPGIVPAPLQWKRGVLTTGPPAKSYGQRSLKDCHLRIQTNTLFLLLA